MMTSGGMDQVLFRNSDELWPVQSFKERENNPGNLFFKTFKTFKKIVFKKVLKKFKQKKFKKLDF